MTRPFLHARRKQREKKKIIFAVMLLNSYGVGNFTSRPRQHFDFSCVDFFLFPHAVSETPKY